MRIIILIITVLFCFNVSAQNKIIDGDNLYNGNLSEKGYMSKNTLKTVYTNYYITDVCGDTLVMPINDSITGIKTLKDTIPKVDSLALPIFSTKEVVGYLSRINNKLMALRELELITAKDYDKVIIEINRIVSEMEKKRRTKTK